MFPEELFEDMVYGAKTLSGKGDLENVFEGLNVDDAIDYSKGKSKRGAGITIPSLTNQHK